MPAQAPARHRPTSTMAWPLGGPALRAPRAPAVHAAAALVACVALAACGGGGGPAAGTAEDSLESAAAAQPAGSVVVRAGASLAHGIGAQMELRVDGRRVGSRMVDNTRRARDYGFGLAAPVAPGARVDVVYVNDAVARGGREDRNLYVESVTVDGRRLAPGDAGVVYDRGVGAAAFDGIDTLPGQPVMAWNGALRFRLPGGPLDVAQKLEVMRAAYTVLWASYVSFDLARLSFESATYPQDVHVPDARASVLGAAAVCPGGGSNVVTSDQVVLVPGASFPPNYGVVNGPDAGTGAGSAALAEARYSACAAGARILDGTVDLQPFASSYRWGYRFDTTTVEFGSRYQLRWQAEGFDRQWTGRVDHLRAHGYAIGTALGQDHATFDGLEIADRRGGASLKLLSGTVTRDYYDLHGGTNLLVIEDVAFEWRGARYRFAGRLSQDVSSPERDAVVTDAAGGVVGVLRAHGLSAPVEAPPGAIDVAFGTLPGIFLEGDAATVYPVPALPFPGPR